MGEYQEDADFNDLLGSDSDENEDGKVQKPSVDNLLSLDDVIISEGTGEHKSKNLDFIFLPESLDDDDDESTTGSQKSKNEEDFRLELDKKRNFQRLLHSVPPGIDLFRQNENKENGFKLFTLDSLNLETDCGYTRRPKLLGHGFSNARLDDMFSDRFEFVRHLFPEAQTVLICNQADFIAIMDFLFFSISVCHDVRLNELMIKAFFDLRKNYGFRWNMNLSHILTCLINFGADKAVVYNERFFQKHLEKHFDAVRKSGQKIIKKYELPSLPDFIKRRRSENGSMASMSAAQFRHCLISFLELITDWFSGQHGHLEFRKRDNWSEQIVLIYIIMVTATDKRIISSHRVRDAVATNIQYHLDSFSPTQWYWGPDQNDQPKTIDGRKDFNHSNVCKSLIILLNEFFPGELCPDTVSWDLIEEHSATVSFGKNNSSDHHLNMIHRLSLIQPSYRGNQFKKYLAFMFLQTIAETVYVTPTHVDVFDIIEIPQLCDQLSPRLRLLVKAKNYEVLMSVVELYDIIVGHEPSVDFTEDKVEAIEKINKNVLQWLEKKLPSMNNINLDDKKSVKGIQLSEYLSLVISRWTSQCGK